MMNLFKYYRRLYDMLCCDSAEFVETACSRDVLSITAKVDGKTYHLTMTEEEEEDD